MAAPRYLIGGGEKLSVEVARPSRGYGDKAHPYTFDEAVERLTPQFKEMQNELRKLPDLAFPSGDAVVGVTLHPTYLAKSHYPSELLAELKLRHLGSRAVHVELDSKKSEKIIEDERSRPAPLLYLAGRRERLLRFAEALPSWRPAEQSVRSQFREIERIALPDEGRAKQLPDVPSAKVIPLEIVLHADAEDGGYILEGFLKFVRSLELDVDLARRCQYWRSMFPTDARS